MKCLPSWSNSEFCSIFPFSENYNVCNSFKAQQIAELVTIFFFSAEWSTCSVFSCVAPQTQDNIHISFPWLHLYEMQCILQHHMPSANNTSNKLYLLCLEKYGRWKKLSANLHFLNHKTFLYRMIMIISCDLYSLLILCDIKVMRQLQ